MYMSHILKARCKAAMEWIHALKPQFVFWLDCNTFNVLEMEFPASLALIQLNTESNIVRCGGVGGCEEETDQMTNQVSWLTHALAFT